MSDTVNVEIGGKSKYEIAYTMAREIFQIENKTPTRDEYLKAFYDCIKVLNGLNPSPSSAARTKGF